MSSVKIANPTVSVPSRFSLLDLLRRCASALFGNLRIHHVLFLAFTIIAAVPVFILSWWVEHRAVQQEINAAWDQHLLIARNLTAAFSRYVFDVKAGFDLAISTFNSGEQAEGLKSLLRSLEFQQWRDWRGRALQARLRRELFIADCTEAGNRRRLSQPAEGRRNGHHRFAKRYGGSPSILRPASAA